jgi:hypothetical protein
MPRLGSPRGPTNRRLGPDDDFLRQTREALRGGGIGAPRSPDRSQLTDANASLVNSETATLEALRNAIDSLDNLRPVGISDLSQTKLDALERTGRPFLKITASMRQTVLRFVKAAASEVLTRSGSIRIDSFMTRAGETAKKVVLLRFKAQGNDIPLRPLRDSTVYAKLHSRNSRVKANAHKIGIATGMLLEDLSKESTAFVFERT